MFSVSTNETVVGKWHDGRIIYRKAISVGQLTNNGQTVKAHGIANLDRVIHMFGSARNTSLDSRYTIALPYSSPTNLSDNMGLTANSTNITIVHSTGKTAYSAVVILEYIKTS